MKCKDCIKLKKELEAWKETAEIMKDRNLSLLLYKHKVNDEIRKSSKSLRKKLHLYKKEEKELERLMKEFNEAYKEVKGIEH